jgi:hypothetical protein
MLPRNSLIGSCWTGNHARVPRLTRSGIREPARMQRRCHRVGVLGQRHRPPAAAPAPRGEAEESPAPSALSNAYVMPAPAGARASRGYCLLPNDSRDHPVSANSRPSSRAVEAGTTPIAPTDSAKTSGGADRIETAKRAAASCRPDSGETCKRTGQEGKAASDQVAKITCLRSSGKDQHIPQVYWQCLNYNGKGQQRDNR